MVIQAIAKHRSLFSRAMVRKLWDATQKSRSVTKKSRSVDEVCQQCLHLLLLFIIPSAAQIASRLIKFDQTNILWSYNVNVRNQCFYEITFAARVSGFFAIEIRPRKILFFHSIRTYIHHNIVLWITLFLLDYTPWILLKSTISVLSGGMRLRKAG